MVDLRWELTRDFLIPYENKKSFEKELMDFSRKHIKTSTVLYKTTQSKILGRGFEMYGGDVKIEGHYLDYFRKRI
jgi:hypothetical protein